MSTSAGLTVLETGELCVARIQGEIDVSNAGDIGEQISSAVTNDTLGLVLDLSEIRYIDSSGVGLLFGLVRSLSSRRQRMLLVVPTASPIRKLLELTRLDASARVETSMELARERARTPETDPTTA